MFTGQIRSRHRSSQPPSLPRPVPGAWLAEVCVTPRCDTRKYAGVGCASDGDCIDFKRKKPVELTGFCRAGWGRWIRTTVSRVRVCCPTARRSPNRTHRVQEFPAPGARGGPSITTPPAWVGENRRYESPWGQEARPLTSGGSTHGQASLLEFRPLLLRPGLRCHRPWHQQLSHAGGRALWRRLSSD